MSYLILGDSCTDLTDDLRQDTHFKTIPLTLHVGGVDIVDDETFNQTDFLKKVADCPECPKSSCPSPDAYQHYFDQADDIFIITLSSHLSGSYNSAQLAKDMYLEDHPDKKIHVFDSLSASVGQTLVGLQIRKLAVSGMAYEAIISETEQFIQEMGTKFVLESLEALRKNGRLSNVSALIANALNIKPVMTSISGTIDKLTQGRGMKKAIQKLADAVAQDAIDPAHKTLGIAHCNNPERAEYTKAEILKRVSFASIYITDTAGVSSLYASDGGIIVCY